LKIAISKLQNDFERVARQTQHPIEISYSLHENDKNNLLEKLETVMQNTKNENLNNKQILEKLEEASQNVTMISAQKLDVQSAYADDVDLK